MYHMMHVFIVDRRDLHRYLPVGNREGNHVRGNIEKDVWSTHLQTYTNVHNCKKKKIKLNTSEYG